jgi:hypothetical protein
MQDMNNNVAKQYMEMVLILPPMTVTCICVEQSYHFVEAVNSVGASLNQQSFTFQ